ncbi:hypothetical protein [Escherichia coli]|uniref:hypothetical protein n=1 Tax=Escherichia coli TaxID=562 RepID=UPI000E0780F0|nr:hypothetical protein [Escherichia coli]STL59031.1 Uncharacterised protein [Escherichia coli]
MRESFSFEPDNLIISGGMPAITTSIKLASGKVNRGELLAFVSIDQTTNVVTVAPINLSGEGWQKNRIVSLNTVLMRLIQRKLEQHG